MRVDFRTITKKDMFMLRLKSEEMDFGYIPKRERKAFVRFCKENELVVPFPNGFDTFVYKAKAKFCYEVTLSGNFFKGICERIAEHTGWYKRYLFHRPFICCFAMKEIIHIVPRPQRGGFDWLQVHKDIIY